MTVTAVTMAAHLFDCISVIGNSQQRSQMAHGSVIFGGQKDRVLFARPGSYKLCACSVSGTQAQLPARGLGVGDGTRSCSIS